MKNKIEPLNYIEIDNISIRLPNNSELMDKINEIINYINSNVVMVGKGRYDEMANILKTSSD